MEQKSIRVESEGHSAERTLSNSPGALEISGQNTRATRNLPAPSRAEWSGLDDCRGRLEFDVPGRGRVGAAGSVASFPPAGLGRRGQRGGPARPPGTRARRPGRPSQQRGHLLRRQVRRALRRDGSKVIHSQQLRGTYIWNGDRISFGVQEHAFSCKHFHWQSCQFRTIGNPAIHPLRVEMFQLATLMYLA